MLNKIRNRVDNKLAKFIRGIEKHYALNSISPLLFKSIEDFVLRQGKRVRPILFIIGYLGFAKKIAKGLYTSALAIELLHDFMLVHDDIIDKSQKRRGKLSMHELLNKYLKSYKDIKFNGQDLSIVIGDIMFAIGINAFLAIKEDAGRKEKALKKFVEAAIYTGCGEFIELINGIKPIDKITKQDIHKIYDYKTARYTFSTPLVTGAILAGADKNEVDKLFKFGIYLGRAFQIKDDILGMFAEEKKIGKSTLTDLSEAKKTLLIWYAYQNSEKKDRLYIKRVLSKKQVTRPDLLRTRKIIKASGSLDYSETEINHLLKKALEIIASSSIKTQLKNYLCRYCKELLSAN